jgi:hypothetical protein
MIRKRRIAPSAPIRPTSSSSRQIKPDGGRTRRANQFASARDLIVACPAPFAKIFLFFRNENQAYDLPSGPERGALRNVINAGRGAVDADGAFDESA